MSYEDDLRTLMLRSLTGDRVAYRELLSLLAGDLKSYFRSRLGGHPDEAEDLMQETLLAIHLKRATYDPTLPLTSWVFAIAHHKLVDWYRLRQRRPVTPLDEAGPLIAQERTEASLAERDVAALLRELPENQAVAIRCVKIEGLSTSEAADRTGQSVASVKVSVHRGLKKLLMKFGSDNK